MNKNRCKAHLYLRTNGKNNYIFKCTRCPSYSTGKAVLGQTAKCNYCFNEFLMSKNSLQVKPHCGCRNTVKINKVDSGLKKKVEDQLEKVADDIKDNFLDDLVRKL